MILISKALKSLYPNSEWIIEDEDYEKIRWIKNEPNVKPTLAQLKEEVLRLEQIELSLDYQRMRRAEYPPVSDYLDGLVKGDQEQMQAYIDACLAVKAKYPKGT